MDNFYKKLLLDEAKKNVEKRGRCATPKSVALEIGLTEKTLNKWLNETKYFLK